MILGLILVPGVSRLSLRLGQVASPRQDRWHRKPTPILGGVAIYLAAMGGLIVYAAFNSEWENIRWELLSVSSLVFLLGLYDDVKQMTPPAKLLGQILAAAAVVFLGYTTTFFTPKITNNVVAQIPNIVLTFVWVVGLTNAINLIDNMDGLAGGISLITIGFLSYFFWIGEDFELLPIAMALAGGILGFLIFNFPPASIFMGDSGSLFLGFTLAVLAIARQPQASNVFAVMGVPALLFLLPILDTTLVTVTRILRGQSPVQGGRDHTSHRLIAFGLSERQTLFVLFCIALISGIVAIGVETLDYWLSLAIVPLLVLSLALLAAYLGRLKVVTAPSSSQSSAITRLMVELTYKRRTFEIGLDFVLIGFAYYLAFWTSFGLSMNEDGLQLYLRSIPIAFVGTYLSFFYFGVYRGLWRYVGVDDLLRFGKATLGGVVLLALGMYLLVSRDQYSVSIFVLFAVYLFLGLAASRSTFKILDQLYGHQTKPEEERVLIIGAGDAGEMAMRWILMNPQLGYQPVGFLDNDPYSTGREIHGVTILGEWDQLESILDQKGIDGVVIATGERFSVDQIESITAICRANGRWVRALRLEFELLE